MRAVYQRALPPVIPDARLAADMANSQSRLLKQLMKLARVRAGQPTGEILVDLKRALLAFGSETPDNVPAVRALKIVPGWRARSLGIRGTSAAIGDIINELASLPIPPALRKEFPDLDQKKWQFALRVTVLILTALDPQT